MAMFWIGAWEVAVDGWEGVVVDDDDGVGFAGVDVVEEGEGVCDC